MSSVKDKLVNMFSKVMAGTVTREEGTMLLNHLAKEDTATTVQELAAMIENPPPGVFPKTILHTIALARNKAFFNLVVASLDHENEGVSILAAEELSKLRTSEAKEVLLEHLNSDSYHVRKASAQALIQGFADGSEIVKSHLLSQREQFYRLTSAQALVKAGRKGIDALVDVLSSGEGGPMMTAAEALTAASGEIDQADVPRIFGALMAAGDKKDAQAIIELLKVAAALGAKARGFEGFVLAFTDYPFEPVRKEAAAALARIRA